MAGIPRDIKDIAKALIDVAEKESATAEVLRDTRLVADVFEMHPTIVRDLRETTISLDRRQQALKKGLKGINSYVVHACLILQQRELLHFMRAFAEYVSASGRKNAKLFEAHITTAIPMTQKEQRALQEELNSSFGGQHEIHESVDPRILGGMVVEIGDKRYDASIKGKLTRLRQALAS